MIQICEGFDQIQLSGSDTKEFSNKLKEIARTLGCELMPWELSRAANERTILGIHEFFKRNLPSTELEILINRLPNHACRLTTKSIKEVDQSVNGAFDNPMCCTCRQLRKRRYLDCPGSCKALKAFIGDEADYEEEDLGVLIIVGSFGEQNYQTVAEGRVFRAELLIDPDTILGAAC